MIFCDSSIQKMIYTLASMLIEIDNWFPELPFKNEYVSLQKQIFLRIVNYMRYKWLFNYF